MNSQDIIGFSLTALLFLFYYLLGLVVVKRFANRLSEKLGSLEFVFISVFTGLFFQIWTSIIIAMIMRNIVVGQVVSICLG
ncbi:MAG: hypothetical protein V1703_01020, partial [Candidatus Altiarchaeota archaeon]